jgi:hypothetical protein
MEAIMKKKAVILSILFTMLLAVKPAMAEGPK